MPANTPAILITLLAKPVVPENLSVEVVSLERRVVDVKLGALEEEEAVMIHKLLA